MYHQKRTRANKKRKRHQGGKPVETRIGAARRKNVKTRGGGVKEKLEYADKANVTVDGKHVRCEVTGLKDNPANKDYTRRNVITKGAIIEVKTPSGEVLEVRVTSRPGQDGVLNAVKKQ
ncbi:MAG: 30S ribosomal protein S8e [Candidatus Altiarchaeales archaeon]|nr:30S ribosomal protein S8e [Candidatus Altiarchaeales archaeon]